MPDFDPWYCTTCEQMIPTSILTHWVDPIELSIAQHSVHPPGSGALTRPEHGLGTRVPTSPPRISIYNDGEGNAQLFVKGSHGDVLARVDVVNPKHVDGSPLPQLIDRLERALALAYYDQIDG